MRTLTARQSTLLDFVRGTSAILVLFGHVFSLVEGDFLFGKKHPWQSLAVSVFFWLSGFLIAYHCLVKDRYRFEDYLIDRFSRIYVLFLPALLLSFVLLVPVGRAWPSISEVLANITMLHHTPFERIWAALPRFPRFMGNAVLWTIAIEWWLYVAFGIFFFAGSGGRIARTVMVILAVPASLVVGYFMIIEYVAFIWVVGAISAYAFVRTTSIDRACVWVALAASAAAFAVRFNLLNGAPLVNMYDLQLNLALSGVLFFSVLAIEGEQDPWRPYAWTSATIAFLSYALYLTHEPVRMFFATKWGWTALSPRQGLVVIAACLAVGFAFAFAFESRHHALRHWLKERLRRAYPASSAPMSGARPL